MDTRRSRSGGLVAAGFHALEEALIAVLLVAMTAATLYRLVTAALSNGAQAPAFDLGPPLLTGLVLLGMSYAVKVNAHLGVDAFVKLFRPGPRRGFGLLAVTAGLAYGGLMLVGAWEHVAGLYRLGTEARGIPQWQLMAILPAGFALLTVRLVQAGLRIWTRRQHDLLHGDEAADALNRHLEYLAASAADRPAAGKARRR